MTSFRDALLLSRRRFLTSAASGLGAVALSALLKQDTVAATAAEEFQPAFSPDGKEVAYLENRVTLKVVNLASKQSRTILTADKNYSYADGDQYYQWSPDGKWFIVQFGVVRLFTPQLGLVSSDGKGQVNNISKSGYDCFKPKWVMAITLLILVAYKFILDGYGDLTMVGNAGQKLDIWLMGENHLYHGEGIAFDPEGWLSTLPAIGNVVFGYFAGRYIQQKSRTDGKIVLGKTYEGLTHLLLAGVVLIFLAYCWNMSFPVNKKLWTSSFVLLTVGLDLVILSTVIYVVDFLHKTKWTYFFQVFGKNPLFIYLLSELLVTVLYMIPVSPNRRLFGWIYQNIFSWAGGYFGSLLFAIAYMLLCWSVGYFLDKRKIYVKV